MSTVTYLASTLLVGIALFFWFGFLKKYSGEEKR